MNTLTKLQKQLNKKELHKTRVEIEKILNNDNLIYLLILDSKYAKMMQDGYLPFAVKQSGYTLKNKDIILDSCKYRLKEVLIMPKDTIKKILIYLEKSMTFDKDKQGYLFIGKKEVISIFKSFLAGKIDYELNFIR